MVEFGVWVVIIVGAIGVGCYIFLRSLTRPVATPAGWVYFLSPKTWDGEKPAPIKIGMTHRDPGVDRLPEIATMSSTPLEVLYCYRSTSPAEEEARVHDDLDKYRLHGEWFERYTTLAYIDNLRESA